MSKADDQMVAAGLALGAPAVLRNERASVSCQQSRPQGCRLVARVVALAIALALLAFAGSASAFTNAGAKGKPGKLVDVYRIQGSHYSWCCNLWNLYFTSNRHVVARSPATSGAQQVSAEFQFYRLESGRWSYKTQETVRARLARGNRRVRLPQPHIWPSANYGVWSALIVYRWRTPGGRVLGRRAIDMNHRGDYMCSTQFSRHCQVGNGWVRVTSPHT